MSYCCSPEEPFLGKTQNCSVPLFRTPPSCGSLDLAYTTGGVSLFEVCKSRSIRFQNFCILIWARFCFEIVSYFVVQLFSDWAAFFFSEMIPPALECLYNKKSRFWNLPRILEHCFGTQNFRSQSVLCLQTMYAHLVHFVCLSPPARRKPHKDKNVYSFCVMVGERRLITAEWVGMSENWTCSRNRRKSPWLDRQHIVPLLNASWSLLSVSTPHGDCHRLSIRCYEALGVPQECR